MYVGNHTLFTQIVIGCADGDGFTHDKECKTLAEIMGTVFLVDGTWYLRYLNGGGAMVPIEGSASINEQLEDGKSVRVTGYMSTDGRGCPRAVQALEIEVFGEGKG